MILESGQTFCTMLFVIYYSNSFDYIFLVSKTEENEIEDEKSQSSVTLKSVATSSRERSQTSINELDQISEDGKSISSAHSDIQAHSHTYEICSQFSHRNMSTTILVPCNTAPKKDMFDQVDTANECAWESMESRNPVTKEEKITT